MATIKRVFKGLTTSSLNGTALTGSEQSSGNIDLATDGYVAAQISVAVAFHASGTQDVEIKVYGYLDSAAVSNIASNVLRIKCDAGTTQRISVVVPDWKHFKITAKEVGSESNHGTVTIKYDAWRFDSA